MKTYQRRGFTLTEALLATAIISITLSLAIGSYVLALGAMRTASDALILQREADQILNMKLGPEIRLVQTLVDAGDRGFVYQHQSPTTGMFETKAFVYQDDTMYFCQDVPYYPDYPETMEEYFNNLSGETYGVEVLGRFVEDVLFSYRDGGNNLVSTTGGTVDDPTAVEIVDVRLTLARDRQVYQVSNSFIPIRQFI